ncbi:BTB/POZ domain-containing protein 19 isoform X5 [Canis lupus baileyi]|uniref:BTB/POZ domain-containing protein 19 isoform X5 n=1 Tax=Canis lupus dingo TaxID=286419 RepID=UPI000DC6B7C7|nr:BTB/POZ domain-containing protein 19 isoform X5 [Canis lupus dingo]XP_038543817.1 BTB/POZ domain-containing protein 19 isoform X5 [Canis lupus familiaris]
METPGLVVQGEAASFSTALRSLLNNPQYSDVCFVVGQERQEVFAHRCLLACRCNFFRGLLGPKLGPGMPSPVVLSTVPAEAFLAVLEFLYTNSVRLHRHSVLEVLTAAVEYGLEELRELCLEFVVKVMDVEMVCEALQVAVTFGLGALQERCVAFIEAHSREALRTRGFLELSAPALLPLLRSDRLCVDEAELVLAARSWARVGATCFLKLSLQIPDTQSKSSCLLIFPNSAPIVFLIHVGAPARNLHLGLALFLCITAASCGFHLLRD